MLETVFIERLLDSHTRTINRFFQSRKYFVLEALGAEFENSINNKEENGMQRRPPVR